jgi:hypothetical protein
MALLITSVCAILLSYSANAIEYQTINTGDNSYYGFFQNFAKSDFVALGRINKIDTLYVNNIVYFKEYFEIEKVLKNKTAYPLKSIVYLNTQMNGYAEVDALGYKQDIYCDNKPRIIFLNYDDYYSQYYSIRSSFKGDYWVGDGALECVKLLQSLSKDGFYKLIPLKSIVDTCLFSKMEYSYALGEIENNHPVGYWKFVSKTKESDTAIKVNEIDYDDDCPVINGKHINLCYFNEKGDNDSIEYRIVNSDTIEIVKWDSNRIVEHIRFDLDDKSISTFHLTNDGVSKFENTRIDSNQIKTIQTTTFNKEINDYDLLFQYYILPKVSIDKSFYKNNALEDKTISYENTHFVRVDEKYNSKGIKQNYSVFYHMRSRYDGCFMLFIGPQIKYDSDGKPCKIEIYDEKGVKQEEYEVECKKK